MSRYGGLQTVSSSRVILNVYDLHESNEQLYPMGLGMYHSGVQIGGLEWTFAGGAGIFSDSPKGAPARFRESIDLGEFAGGSRDVDAILDDLRQKYRPDSYNILSQNCNCFAEDFVQRLLGIGLPGYVNRLAEWGTMVQCLIPPSLMNQQGPGGSDPGQGSASSAGGSQFVTNRFSQNPASSFSGSAAKLGGNDGGAGSKTSASSESLRRARLSALGASG